MLKVVVVAALWAIGISLSATDAQAAAIRCDTCMHSGDFRAQAVARGPGVHIVYNITNDTLQQYYVGSGMGGGGPGVPRSGLPSAGVGNPVIPAAARPVVRQQTPPAAAVQEVRAGHRIYLEGGMTLRPTIVVPVSQLGLNANAASKTAYDYVGDYNLQAMVESATGNVEFITRVVNAGFVSALSDLIQMASNFTGLRDQARMMFKIVFSDGSYVTVIVDLQNQNGKTEPSSARTPNGQLIPTDIQELRGEWTNAGGENLNRMAEHMSTLGATVKSTGSIGTGVVRGITCSGSGSEKICHVQFQMQ